MDVKETTNLINFFKTIENHSVPEYDIDRNADYQGYSVLHKAAKYLSEAQIKQLVNRGYEKDIVNENGQYPFHIKGVACLFDASLEIDDDLIISGLRENNIIPFKFSEVDNYLHIFDQVRDKQVFEKLIIQYNNYTNFKPIELYVKNGYCNLNILNRYPMYLDIDGIPLFKYIEENYPNKVDEFINSKFYIGKISKISRVIPSLNTEVDEEL